MGENGDAAILDDIEIIYESNGGDCSQESDDKVEVQSDDKVEVSEVEINKVDKVFFCIFFCILFIFQISVIFEKKCFLFKPIKILLHYSHILQIIGLATTF